jgi:hypothetical protein
MSEGPAAVRRFGHPSRCTRDKFALRSRCASSPAPHVMNSGQPSSGGEQAQPQLFGFPSADGAVRGGHLHPGWLTGRPSATL